MKLICDGLDLSEAVLKVSKALSVKSTNPVLEGIKLTAKGDSLTLLATDMELAIKKTIKAEILMEGETVVVGKYFVDFTRKLNSEQVELCKFEESKIQIKYADAESDLQVFSADSFPKIESNEDGDYFEISEKEFKKIVERTTFSCSTDDSRPILKGCLFEINNGILTSVALDGYRMSLVKKEVKSSGNFKAVIPARTLMEITRHLDKDEKDIKVILNKNTLSVEIENTTIISRLIEGEFVKYSHILPTSFENKVTINKNLLQNSVERASVVAKSDRYNIIKFDIKENLLNISSKSEIGNVNENINISLEGKDLTIAFDGKYLLEFLKIVDEDFIYINLNSPIDPCVITPVGDNEMIYLILPIRINN